VQRGSTVVLSWPSPALGTQESSRDYIVRAEIYRLIEAREDEPVLDIDDYEETAEVIGYIDRATMEGLAKSLGGMQYTDSVDIGGAQATGNLRLRYAVRYINKRGQKSMFSNTVALEPVAAVASEPTGLTATATAQNEVKIEWMPPETNVGGTRPASVLGYNLYRRGVRREGFGRPLNSEPLTETRFIDKKFQYKTEYTYMVRALSQGTTGLIESTDSELSTFTPVDTFPPSSPDPVSAASANGIISLFWPTSPEPDVVGYNIYRADSADASESAWIRLTPEPLTNVTTYRDDRVVIGKRYFYKVTAVDRFDNESAPSKAVSEEANQ
jgi:fibronectin type 3 domain-containing protein